jgi:hypothetical protein
MVLSLSLTKTIESQKREQARNNLHQIKYCFEKINKKFDIKESFAICSNKSKTSFTGDVYILDKDTLEFVYETSRDVPSKNMYFTKESIGKYFNDWDSAEKALKIITLGKDSENGINVSYYFDDAKEWLEWKYLPNEFEDVNGRQYIAIQGTQSDEALRPFKNHIVFNYLIIFIVSFILIILQKQSRQR